MESVKLSRRLVEDIVEVLRRREPACSDRLIAAQYLSAVIAYLLASHSAAPARKEEILDELTHFLHHVYGDLSRAQPPQPQSAFGIWKPPQ